MTSLNEIRNLIIAANGLTNVDEQYTFYYDETNNYRKLHLTNNGLNIRRPKCFVLGGVVHRGPTRLIDLAGLRSALKIPSNIDEIKVNDLMGGEFLQLLKSERLGIFLRWLNAQDLLIHYQVTDLLYWSIVDIVDSILHESDMKQLFAARMALKDTLYSVLRDDVDATAKLLGRYDYPNVGRERRKDFIADLLQMIEPFEERLDHFAYYMLKGLLQAAKKIESLPYLEDETPMVLIDGLGPFFFDRLLLFKNSQHIFDDEPQIERYLNSSATSAAADPLQNYRFTDSKTESGVQLSDLVSGLLGRMFTYVNQATVEQLEEDMSNLSDRQLRNLRLLAERLDASANACAAFAHYLISMEDRQRARFVLRTGTP